MSFACPQTRVHSDCYMEEAVRNGSGNIVYSFARCRTTQNKKCYLGMYRDGRMRSGAKARQSQSTAQWLTRHVPLEELKPARDTKERISKPGGWTAPSPYPPPTSPASPVSPEEQRRKRVRRWCRNLDVMLKRPDKFLERCKYDCQLLERMVQQPNTYMRRCLVSLVRRRERQKARKKAGLGGGDGGGAVAHVNMTSVRAKVRRLWPQRKEIFRRLRQLRRCNKKKEKKGRGQGHKGHSCSMKDIRRQQRRRAKRRRKTEPSSASGPASADLDTPRSRSRSPSRSDRKRVRHSRKKTGRKRRHRHEAGASGRSTERLGQRSATLETPSALT